MIVWLIAMLFVGLWAAFWVLLGTRGWAGLLVLLLVPSLTLLLGVGNVDALILLGIVAAWPLAEARRDRPLGLLVGLLVSIKLTPAVLLVWLLVERRWVALAWAVASIIVLAIAAALATDVAIWARYLEVLRDGAATGRPWALAALAIGFLAMAALRDRPRWSYALAIILIPVGSPQAAGHSWAILLSALAPWCSLRPRCSNAWPRPTRTMQAHSPPATDVTGTFGELPSA